MTTFYTFIHLFQIPVIFNVAMCSNVSDMCVRWKDFVVSCDKDYRMLQIYNLECTGMRPKRPQFKNVTEDNQNNKEGDGFFTRTWVGFKDMFG